MNRKSFNLKRTYEFNPHEIPTMLVFEKYCLKSGKNLNKELIKALHFYLNIESEKKTKEKMIEKTIREVSIDLGTKKIINEFVDR